MSSNVKCSFCFKPRIKEKPSISNVNIIKFLCKQLNVDFNVFENDPIISSSTLVLPLCALCDASYVEELVTIYETLQKVKGQLETLIENVKKEVSVSYGQEDNEVEATPQAKASRLFRDEVSRSANVFVKLEIEPNEEEEEFDDTIGDEMDQLAEVKVEAVLDDETEMDDDNAEDFNSVKNEEDDGSDRSDIINIDAEGDSSSIADTEEEELEEVEDSQPARKKVKIGGDDLDGGQEAKSTMGNSTPGTTKLTKIWKCKICPNITFRQEERLQMHIKVFHDSMKLIQRKVEVDSQTVGYKLKVCDDGPQESKESGMYNQTSHSHNSVIKKYPKLKIYSCSRPSCGKEFTMKNLYKKHLEFHNDDIAKYPNHPNCEECGIVFKTEEGLKTHKEKHHKTSKIGRKYCRFCKQTSIYTYKIRKHEVEKHLDQLTHACSSCPEKYSTSQILETHTKTHAPLGPYSCSICKNQSETETFLTAQSLQNHLILCHIPKETHQPPVPLPKRNYTCEICGLVLQSPARLKIHTSSHKNNQFACELCPEVLLKPNWMLKHVVDCHETVELTKTIVCTKCPKKFATNFMLERHMKRHQYQEKKPYGCEICEACFSTDSNIPKGLKHHMKIKHQEVQKRRYACRGSGCNSITFSSKTYRNQHEREKHPELLIYSCTLCDKVYQEKEFLDTHVKVHGDEEPRLNCEVCKSVFATRDALAEHLFVHTGEFRFKCPHCPRPFRFQKNLDDHVATHTGEKPHECQVCKKKFAKKSNVNTHFELVHGGPDGSGSKFACDLCDKTYTAKVSLRTHKNRDHGLGEYKPARKVICDICGKSIRQIFLKTHIQIHEGTVELKKTCTVCGKRFRTGNELKVHTLIHTGEKRFTCHICQKGFTQSHSWKSHLEVHRKNGTYTHDP